MTDTKGYTAQNVQLPTGMTIMTNPEGLVVMKPNDLVRAIRQATLDGAAMRHFYGQANISLASLHARAVPVDPKFARWAHVAATFSGHKLLMDWVAERHPLLKFERTVWHNRKQDLIVPPYGRVWFQVEAGQLLYRRDDHPDVPDNWKVCDIPVVAFTANQLNILRKLFKSPSVSETITED